MRSRKTGAASSAPSTASRAMARSPSRRVALRHRPRSRRRSPSSVELRANVALVTGAGRRVGRAIALALGARGMRVAVHYHASADGAQRAAEEITAAGGDGWPIAADLRDPLAAEPLMQRVAEHFGALDVLVNSAAIMLRTPLDTVTPQQWDEMFAINLRAPFFCARAAATVMGDRGGVIINIADLAGMETWPA